MTRDFYRESMARLSAIEAILDAPLTLESVKAMAENYDELVKLCTGWMEEREDALRWAKDQLNKSNEISEWLDAIEIKMEEVSARLDDMDGEEWKQ